MDKAIEVLVAKIDSTTSAEDALKISQATLNLANATAVLKNCNG